MPAEKNPIIQPKTQRGAPMRIGQKSAKEKDLNYDPTFYGRAPTGHRYWKVRDSLGRWSTIKARDIEYLEPRKKRTTIKKRTSGKETRKKKGIDWGDGPTTPLKEGHYYVEKITVTKGHVPGKKYYLVYHNAKHRLKILKKLAASDSIPKFSQFKSGPIGQKAKAIYALSS